MLYKNKQPTALRCRSQEFELMEWMELQDKKGTHHKIQTLLQAVEGDLTRMWETGCLPVRLWAQASQLERKPRTRVVNFTVECLSPLSRPLPWRAAFAKQ